MSIKIWEAWRIPKAKQNNFLVLVNDATMKKFYLRLDDMWGWIRDSEVQEKVDRLESEVREKNNGKLPKWYGGKSKQSRFLSVKLRLLREKLKEAGASSESRWFDADASLNIWLDGRYAYVIPYGRWALPDELPDWVEDYHYQDQTDRPEGISDKQYAARCKKWHEVCLDDWDAIRLVHTMVDFLPLAWRSWHLAEIYLKKKNRELRGVL